MGKKLGRMVRLMQIAAHRGPIILAGRRRKMPPLPMWAIRTPPMLPADRMRMLQLRRPPTA